MILFCNGHEKYRYSSFSDLLGCDWYFNLNEAGGVIKFDSLIGWMKETGITKFITSSHIPRTHFRVGINIFKVMHRMGIQSFLIDNDPFDWRPNLIFYRSVLNAPRFSTWGILNAYWDELLNINDVLYTPLLQDYYSHAPQYETGSKIIVCSQLRSSESVEVVSWDMFFEEREAIQKKSNPIHEKILAMPILFRNFMKTLDAYKATIIGWIRDKRNLEIYGNDEWAKLFPDNYKGWLTEEQYVAKLMEPNIFILPNISATYLDAFGPLFDMVRFGKRFLHQKVMSGNIPAFEFSCADELNDKLANFLDQTDEMLRMKEYYQGYVDSAIQRIMA